MKLQNQEIYVAYKNLLGLVKLDLPVETKSKILGIARVLAPEWGSIERERNRLIEEYGVFNPSTSRYTLDSLGENAGNFAREFGIILARVCPTEFTFERVKIPKQGIPDGVLEAVGDKLVEAI